MSNRQTSELQTLRQELQLYRFYVESDELRSEIKQWIADSQSKDASTLEEHIQQQLLQLRAEYPMRWHPELQEGTDGFPDDCSGCPHYGSACPIVADREQRKTRERRLSEAATEAEARSIWRDISVSVGCRRIPEWLQEWSSEHQDFISRGHRLLERVEDLTLDAEQDKEALPEEMRDVDERDDVMPLGGLSDA